MTHTEVNNALYNRIGWLTEIGVSDVLTDENKVTESGQFFQMGFHFVSINNIRETADTDLTADADFNKYLKQLKTKALQRVITDVFKEENIARFIIDKHVTLFDVAYMLSMAIIVAEQIIYSTQSSRTERITKSFLQVLYIELKGKDNKHNLLNLYEVEIERVKKVLGKKQRLTVVTAWN